MTHITPPTACFPPQWMGGGGAAVHPVLLLHDAASWSWCPPDTDDSTTLTQQLMELCVQELLGPALCKKLCCLACIGIFVTVLVLVRAAAALVPAAAATAATCVASPSAASPRPPVHIKPDAPICRFSPILSRTLSTISSTTCSTASWAKARHRRRRRRRPPFLGARAAKKFQ